MLKLSAYEVGYLAGILDGEGSINCVFSGNRYQFKITIHTSSDELAHWLQSLGIGRLQDLGNGMKIFNVWNKYYVELLTLLLPHLKIKVSQANVILEYLNNKEAYTHDWRKGLSDEERKWRHSLWEKLKALNGRKTTPYVPVSCRD
jgi:hypothetical protein